jgi:hypothetical protein
MINKDKIKPSDVAAHLAKLPGMTEKNAWQLLDPSDKQNVPKAVTLLQSLLQLKDLPKPLDPSENQKQKALIFAAEMIVFFIRPFIEVDMDIANQLQNLATYSFLAAAMHIKHGTCGEWAIALHGRLRVQFRVLNSDISLEFLHILTL